MGTVVATSPPEAHVYVYGFLGNLHKDRLSPTQAKSYVYSLQNEINKFELNWTDNIGALSVRLG